VLGHKPVIWLASGDVSIEGDLYFGPVYIGGGSMIPGAGGFYGGRAHGIVDGQGPGGSPGADSPDYPSNDYVNAFLVPLIGGSGRGANLQYYYDGESGGGALLLASSTKIELPGNITGDIGGGGSLRLMANEITGDGGIYCEHVRMEAYQHNFRGFPGLNTRLSRPGLVFYDNPIKITVVDSTTVANNPGANKNTPDAEINNSGTSTIQVECSQIPLGTTIRVVGWNETYGQVEATTGPLTGTLEASTATCEMIIPPGYTTFMAQAVLP